MESQDRVNVSDIPEMIANIPHIAGGPNDSPIHPGSETGVLQGAPSPDQAVQPAQQEQQVQPRPDEATAAPQVDDTPRIPKERLDREIAAKKKLREEMETAREELAELRKQLQKSQFEKEVQELASGRGRPSDWEVMSPEEQDAWRFQRQAEILAKARDFQSDQAAAPSGGSELQKRLDRLEFQTSLDLPPQQASYIAELREEMPTATVTELKALAAMRQPHLFASGSGDTGSPAQFQQTPGRGSTPPPQKRDTGLNDAMSALNNAVPGLDADRAGADLIGQVFDELVYRPEGFR